MYTPERSQTEVFADNLSRILKEKSPACCKRKASSGADERTRT